jgi:hypothetical protein
MLVVNFVTQGIMAGEGQAACVGAVVPFAYGWLVSWATLDVPACFDRIKDDGFGFWRGMCDPVMMQHPRDHQQGIG